MNLVIVESPTKAKTISKFLNKDFVIKASIGHVRDLPKSKMGVDIEKDFEPQYEISKDKTKVVKELKQLSKESDEIYFATDEDREGEAITWHLAYLLGIPNNKIKRICFHEITKDAILHALENPRKIDQNLVDAQQARRVLDRLVGYELSPFLWKKVYYGLSAGRVQSVAVRLIVERELEREQFKKEEYWTIGSDFNTLKKENISAELNKINGKKLDKFDIQNEKDANNIKNNLEKLDFKIANIDEKNSKKSVPTPFTTSTLQQEAANKFGYSAKNTMRIAQQLYEGINIGKDGQVGLITYMRTDSVNLSEFFMTQAKEYIIDNFGKQYYNGSFRVFKTKSKMAQEAHEAIRPTFVNNSPESIKQFLDPEQYKIYKLIWDRSVATQMKDAESKTVSYDIEDDKKSYSFRASGTTIVFDGFMKVYSRSGEDNILPKVEIGEKVELIKISCDQHFTEPPARYNDAGLIKALEENGIGRPSTYATITSTILERKYVEKDEAKRYYPTDTGRLVNRILCEHFPEVVDVNFTAKMEDDFDEIAEGNKDWKPFIKEFYTPFKKNLEKKDKELDKKELTEEASNEICEKCKSKMVIKYGRFGKFYACSNYPECKNTKEIGADGKQEEEEVLDEKCEKCGAQMAVKRGRYGKFIACSNYPTCKNIKKQANGTGIKCLKCGDGEMVQKRSRFGFFYSCSNYPKCNYILSNKPVPSESDPTKIAICKKCGSGLVYYGKDGDKIKCSNRECVDGNARKKK